jgi:hypothetical protein
MPRLDVTPPGKLGLLLLGPQFRSLCRLAATLTARVPPRPQHNKPAGLNSGPAGNLPAEGKEISLWLSGVQAFVDPLNFRIAARRREHPAAQLDQPDQVAVECRFPVGPRDRLAA